MWPSVFTSLHFLWFRSFVDPLCIIMFQHFWRNFYCHFRIFYYHLISVMASTCTFQVAKWSFVKDMRIVIRYDL